MQKRSGDRLVIQHTHMCSAALVLLLALLGPARGEGCGKVIKEVSYDGHKFGWGAELPYTENMAKSDWEPFTYLDGYHGDASTKGTTNERVHVVKDGSAQALRVLFPKGCVTSACAMQAKGTLAEPTDSATLKFQLKFGPNFDWVRGGKLPGLCGARCLTGCKDVTGLDGFSSRHMWRPCVWPPEAPQNAINCVGGKLVAYVYHMYKVHGCGDDYEFSSDLWEAAYKTPKGNDVEVDFFQPKPDEWYTIWSYVKMNTAGPPGRANDFKRDGMLQTWLEGPGLPPVMVMDRRDMGWRRYNNVSIDTLYFSVFFGGSSESFQAQKDETMFFDNFKVNAGRCPPGAATADDGDEGNEGDEGDEGNEGAAAVSVAAPTLWPSFKTDLSQPSILSASMSFTRTFPGGGCGTMRVVNRNTFQACDSFVAQINVRPSWGAVSERDGAPLLTNIDLIGRDADAGWYEVLVQGSRGRVGPAALNERVRFCVRSFEKVMLPPEELEEHVIPYATCASGPASQATVEPVLGVKKLLDWGRWWSGFGWGAPREELRRL